MKKLLLLALFFCAFISLFFIPELFQSTSIKSSISKIELSLKETKSFKPELGYNINFQNGEWLIIDLHHGSAGYTIAYDSNHKVSVINDYSTIYPSYEVWGPICNKSYDSIENFFLENKRLNWKNLN
jgi:hypothetical protein